MSIAKRDKGKDKEAPPNEDEGNEVNDQNRFARTNQAIKWAKGGIADAKLYIYAKTGQIQESEDTPIVTEAFQKLDTYKEQIGALLKHAEDWTTSMLQTWNHQKSLIDSLNEANSVIHTFNKDAQNKIENNIQNTDDLEFTDIIKGISNELHLDQEESEKRYGQASSLLVVPLSNILNHEIQHAVDMKRRYTQHKRQFDNCCTNITHLRNKIEEIDNPKIIEPTDNESVTTFGKLKMGFGKLIQSNPTKEELQSRLIDARSELPQYVKAYDCTKQQLLEAIGIVEQKLNVEVVYYVQQFYSYVLKWKSGNSPKVISASDGYHGDEEEQDVEDKESVKKKEDKEEEVIVEEIKMADNVDEVYKKIKEENTKFVEELQIDAMISSGAELDEVSLDSNKEVQQILNEEEKIDNAQIDNVDNDKVNDVDNNGNDDIEISENHDIQT